jgi:pimeloyl-ACP methyl ester carboxylesterase
MLLALALALTVDSTTIRDIPLAPGESLHVTIVGSGRPVVILPGLVASAYAFRNVIPHLTEAGLQSIVVEPLGVGASGRPSKADYSLTAQADRIAAVLDTLRLSHVLVVAHSVSVSMALRMAYRRPDLVGGILADNGGPVETAATPGVKKAAKYAWLIKLFGGSGSLRKKLRAGLIETSGDSTWVTSEVIDNYAAGRAGNLGAVLDVMKGMARSLEPEPLTPRLAEIGIPVRLLVGAAPNGSGINAEDQAALSQQVKQFTVDSIRGAGLHIHEEQPEVVARAIVEMMAEERAGT